MQVVGDSVHIREAREEDAEAICRLSSEELGYECSPELVKANFMKLQPDREKVFAAVSGETVLGFVHVEKYQVLYADAMANPGACRRQDRTASGHRKSAFVPRRAVGERKRYHGHAPEFRSSAYRRTRVLPCRGIHGDEASGAVL